MTFGALLVYALAAARVTGLITTDELTRPARDAVFRRLDPRRSSHLKLVTLLTCQWCAGLWVSAVAAPIAWWHGSNPWFLLPALALAGSQITGMLSPLGRRD